MTFHIPTRVTIVTCTSVGLALMLMPDRGRFEASAAGTPTGQPGNRTRAGGLDAMLAAVAARMQVKDALVLDLIDGKTTLREVAARFLAMNAEAPGYMSGLRSRFPGLTDEELTARVVLEFVELQESVPADRKREAWTRAADEFHQAFGTRPELAATPAVPARRSAGGRHAAAGPVDRAGRRARSNR